MLTWISKGDRLLQQSLELEAKLCAALLEQESAYNAAEVVRLRGELTRAARTNDSLATAHAELAVTITELRDQAAGSLAARDAMEAAMSEKYMDKLVGRPVMLHTKGLNSLEGVLVAVYPDVVVLKHASHVDPIDGSRQTLEGEQIVPRPFEFIQELAFATDAQNA